MQSRRPGSPPSWGTTVAGQRRDLTGLRWHCITASFSRGSANVRSPDHPVKQGQPDGPGRLPGYWPSSSAAMAALASR